MSLNNSISYFFSIWMKPCVQTNELSIENDHFMGKIIYVIRHSLGRFISYKVVLVFIIPVNGNFVKLKNLLLFLWSILGPPIVRLPDSHVCAHTCIMVFLFIIFLWLKSNPLKFSAANYQVECFV